MRNCAEWVIAFWACHLLGAVSAQVNAWLPAQPFLHCLALVAAKVVLVDPERAKVLVPHLAALRKGTRVLVARADGGAPRKDAFRAPRGMASFDGEIDAYRGPLDAWRQEPECTLDDNATIFFTVGISCLASASLTRPQSGTTGMPKAVLATQRSFQHGFMVRPAPARARAPTDRAPRADLRVRARAHAAAPRHGDVGPRRPQEHERHPHRRPALPRHRLHLHAGALHVAGLAQRVHPQGACAPPCIPRY